jgi:hypothetical protein
MVEYDKMNAGKEEKERPMKIDFSPVSEMREA